MNKLQPMKVKSQDRVRLFGKIWSVYQGIPCSSHSDFTFSSKCCCESLLNNHESDNYVKASMTGLKASVFGISVGKIRMIMRGLGRDDVKPLNVTQHPECHRIIISIIISSSTATITISSIRPVSPASASASVPSLRWAGPS